MSRLIAQVLNIKPNESEGKTTFGNLFKKNDKEPVEEYVCPFKYCDKDIVEGRKITGVRQSGGVQEKTFIDILHENAVRQMCGTLSEEDPNAQYERPYIGRIFQTIEQRKRYEQFIKKKIAKEKQEAERAKAKKFLFDELPGGF